MQPTTMTLMSPATPAAMPIRPAERPSATPPRTILISPTPMATMGLLAVLDPDAVIRIDGAARIAGGAADAADTPRELRGASTWAKQFISMSRGLRSVQPALINGSVGLIVAPGARLSRVLTFTFTDAKIARLEVIGDPAHLRELSIAVL